MLKSKFDKNLIFRLLFMVKNLHDLFFNVQSQARNLKTQNLLIVLSSAGHFRKPVRKSANPQIADSRFWFADLRTDFLPQTFADLR